MKRNKKLTYAYLYGQSIKKLYRKYGRRRVKVNLRQMPTVVKE